jgi:hypothetical protein
VRTLYRSAQYHFPLLLDTTEQWYLQRKSLYLYFIGGAPTKAGHILNVENRSIDL